MSFNAPTSVPQITYPYTSTQNPLYDPPSHSMFNAVPPTARDIYINHQLNQHFVLTKAALLSMLKTRQLSNLPFGFPFRCVPVASGRIDGDRAFDLSSYEFPEYVTVDPISPPCCAIFSYAAPAYQSDPSAKNRGSLSKMTWRIRIPSRDTMSHREPRTFTTVSQVEVDPEILETFGVEFMENSHIIFEALSVSLEQGLHLTLQLYGPGVVVETSRGIYTSRQRSSESRSDDLVFVAKKSNGQREVIHVYGRCGVSTRKS